MHKSVEIKAPKKFEASNKLKATFSILAFLGLVAFVFGLFNDATRTWQAYLLSSFFFLSMALMGLFYVAIHFLVQAGWSVNVRRLYEAAASFLPVSALLGLVFMIFGASSMYEWLDPQKVAHDSLLQHKASYLNLGFFWVRFVVFYLGWIAFNKFIVGGSQKQDKTGEVMWVKTVVPKCVLYILFFVLSYSLFSVDFLMSLQPHWFSTIFGVYMYSGASQAFFAFMILVAIFLIRSGYYKGMVNENHVHDLAKFLLGFTIFWAYIAFSQFMLIWYANLPEETIFFRYRMEGAWAWASLALVFFKFIVPFLALLPRWAKRDFNYLSIVCVLVLITQFMDLHWLIYPNFDAHHVNLSLWDVLIFGGFAGVYGLVFIQYLAKNSLIPMKDPHLAESANHEVVY